MINVHLCKLIEPITRQDFSLRPPQGDIYFEFTFASGRLLR